MAHNSIIFAERSNVMIQRIQSVYLALVIVLLSTVTLGIELFSFVSDTSRFVFSSFGITEYDLEGKVIAVKNFPIFIGLIALILLSFICLMSYKNLARQFKLGRTIFYIYFLMLVSLLLLAFMGDSLIDVKEAKRELGLGFFLFVAGFPFSFLANTGIKRDKKLLDSLNRLR